MAIGKRKIQKALSDCRFDPNTPGVMKIISDANNTIYYEQHAIEFIKIARMDNIDYDDLITKAIQLLILAKLTRKEI